MMTKTVLANGRDHAGRSVDITCRDGVVTAVEPARPDRPGFDLGGRLVLGAPAEPHAHLDKALTADLVPNPTGDLHGAIDAWNAFAGRADGDAVAARARRAVEMSLANGITAIRSHVNVLPDVGTVPAEAVMAVRDEYRGVVDVQVVAMVGCPATGPEGEPYRRLWARVLELGADVVGGCPHLDPDPDAFVELALDLADDHGLPVDLHTDETLDPSMLTLETLARRVVDRGFDRQVTASHCVSLGMASPATQARVAAAVASADIGVVTLPQTNLFLQGRDTASATPRGLTAVAALADAGVTVAAGADNLQDPFNTVGRADPLETAALMVMAAHLEPGDAYDAVSARSRALMGLPPAGPEVGRAADLLVVDATSVREAVATAPASRTVVAGGRVVADTSVATRRDTT